VLHARRAHSTGCLLNALLTMLAAGAHTPLVQLNQALFCLNSCECNDTGFTPSIQQWMRYVHGCMQPAYVFSYVPVSARSPAATHALKHLLCCCIAFCMQFCMQSCRSQDHAACECHMHARCNRSRQGRGYVCVCFVGVNCMCLYMRPSNALVRLVTHMEPVVLFQACCFKKHRKMRKCR